MSRPLLPSSSEITEQKREIGFLQQLVKTIAQSSTLLDQSRAIAGEIPQIALVLGGNEAGFE